MNINLINNCIIPFELPSQEDICKKIQIIGKVSHRSEPKSSPEDFVSKWVTKAHHESLLEFIDIIIYVKCDRAVANEFVRHRIASYIQESTRYVNYNKKEPEFIGYNNEELIEIAYDFAYNKYLQLIEKGYKPEIARKVLPLGLATTLVMKMNLRAWKHFFDMRDSIFAHPEAKEIAHSIHELFISNYPIIFGDNNGSK